MGIRESLLNTITSVSNGDFIRVVTSAGASSKATLANVIKSFETGLGAKSSLTTSDYIRVVGSDDVLYKQSVNDVNKTIPLTLVIGLTTEALINEAYLTAHSETPDQTPYRRIMNHGMAHSVLGGGRWYLEGYKDSSAYGWQKATSYGNPTKTYTRSLNNGTWTAWVKEPTRAEIDAVSTKEAVTVSAATNVVIDTNKSWKYGKTLFLNVKGHTTASIPNALLFRFSGVTVNPNQFTFGIPMGDGAWTIGGMTYGYINSDGVVATISSGKYFHIAQAFLCE